jgi:hypothetical protein
MDLKSIHTAVTGFFHPQPITHKLGDQEYRVVPSSFGLQLESLIVPPAKPSLQVKSLTGFLDTFAAGIDDFAAAGKVAVHVVDHETVALVSLEADAYGRRHEWLRAVNTEKNPFPFDAYQQPEAFLLSLQQGFLPTEDVVQLQKLASALSSDSSISTNDDGFSQTVTVKQGAVTRGTAEIPKRIKLMPYRTFREIDPVESEFIVRLKGAPGSLPTVALIPVDAGKWKHDTALLVKRWLVGQLPDNTVVIA